MRQRVRSPAAPFQAQGVRTMKRTLPAVALLTLLVLFRPASADPPTMPGTVFEVSGKVVKVDDKTVSIQTRRPDGKFGEAITFQFTNTTRVTRLRLTKMGEAFVAAQIQATPKDLEKDQMISVIGCYNGQVDGKDVNVLLSAVIQPAR
jgi:hypothetical protein